ncbi:MAG: hypothetical protein V4690_01135 [Patescibacteria group bacterium]
MRQRADTGKFLIIGEAPMDTDTFDLGQKHTVEEAVKVADDYVATNPRFLSAQVFNDQEQTVYSVGVI